MPHRDAAVAVRIAERQKKVDVLANDPHDKNVASGAARRFIRFGPVVLAALGVAAAGWAGLGRIAVVPALAAGGAGEWHGAIMVTAIATFIAVERATVIRRQWVWAAPALSALGL